MSTELEKLELRLKQTLKLRDIAPRKYRASGADMLDIEQQITELKTLISAEKRKGKK